MSRDPPPPPSPPDGAPWTGSFEALLQRNR